MTAKRRARKFNTTRSNSDDDPYTRRIREASAGAKAARARLRGEAGGSQEAASGGQGFVVGDFAQIDILFPQEAVRPEAAPDAAPLAERGTAEAPGQPSDEQEAGFQEAVAETAERFRNITDWEAELLWGTKQPTDEQIVEMAEQEVRIKRALREAGDYGTHREFIEGIVNGLPEHIETKSCTCDAGKDHWTEVGEI